MSKFFSRLELMTRPVLSEALQRACRNVKVSGIDLRIGIPTHVVLNSTSSAFKSSPMLSNLFLPQILRRLWLGQFGNVVKMVRLIGIFLLLSISSVHVVSAQEDNLYDETTFRTLNLTFDQSDYWQQLIDHKEQDIFISAELEVDGITYPDMGVRFKGNSSYNGVGIQMNGSSTDIQLNNSTITGNSEGVILI